MPLAVTRAGVVLAGDAVVVAVESIGVIAGATVLEEEDLGGALRGKVRAVLVAGHGLARE
jgi:hypothetical protein